MTYTIQFGSGAFSLPEAMLSYLDKADPMTLKLFLLLCSDKALLSSLDVKAVAKSFAVTEREIEASLAFWQNAGLLQKEKGDEKEKPSAPVEAKRSPRVKVSEKTSANGEKVTVVSSDAMPNYTGREIERLISENPDFSHLIDECQAIAGKVFGIHEINRVLGLADVLRFDHASILLLFGYAESLGKCSVNYVVKMAQGMVNSGISTFAEVEAYIADKEKVHSVERVIRRLAGLGSRQFSAKESRFLAAWSSYEFSEELLTLAYEITVNNTGEFSFPYMNKILMNWHEAGYRTRDEVEASLAAFRDKKAAETDGGTSFDVDDFFAAAIKRTQKLADDT